jgi:hypothetical protein
MPFSLMDLIVMPCKASKGFRRSMARVVGRRGRVEVGQERLLSTEGCIELVVSHTALSRRGRLEPSIISGDGAFAVKDRTASQDHDLALR